MKELLIDFKDRIATPKYRQIIDAVQHQIREGELKRGDKIPSLNQLCKQYGLSQDTVLMAYNELKSRGTITSQVGKGYFIQSEQLDFGHKVLLLFDKLTAYKEALYESFKATLNKKGMEQTFFHHNNLKLFETILSMANGEYSEYVIMPIADKSVKETIAQLPKNKVYILDQGKNEFEDDYPFVCQNFKQDILNILKENLALVEKYDRLILVTGKQGAPRKEIALGFKAFCESHSKPFKVIAETSEIEIQNNDAFLVIDDKDLEYLVRYAMEHNLVLGENIGVVSYNESPLKGIVANGITTISTDFAQMGKSMAEMIIHQRKAKIDNPFNMIKRASF